MPVYWSRRLDPHLFHALEKDLVEDFAGHRQEYYSAVVVAVPQISLLWQLDEDALFAFLRDFLFLIDSLLKFLFSRCSIIFKL